MRLFVLFRLLILTPGMIREWNLITVESMTSDCTFLSCIIDYDYLPFRFENPYCSFV